MKRSNEDSRNIKVTSAAELKHQGQNEHNSESDAYWSHQDIATADSAMAHTPIFRRPSAVLRDAGLSGLDPPDSPGALSPACTWS